MSAPTPRGRPVDGLPPERTALAWTRTSLSVLANGILLSVRELTGAGPLRPVPACLAAAVAVLTYLVGVRRQRLLRRRPLPGRVAARGEIHTIALSILTLIVVTALATPDH